MPWDYPGFDSEEEYVQFWLPRIGLRDMARAQRDQQAAWMREKRAKDAKEGNA